ncbi:hypothetical protein Hypma_007115 [Hypsizygus marmoreus]|uniref:Uncharacterized protein n=1 Tax=Hypsizygus marmoreus TaxID=39966 RepID=A0A369KH86_HYPMA|nr:hypothetical protein Hypma_007115 [Hypsizygus marmoreus]
MLLDSSLSSPSSHAPHEHAAVSLGLFLCGRRAGIRGGVSGKRRVLPQLLNPSMITLHSIPKRTSPFSSQQLQSTMITLTQPSLSVSLNRSFSLSLALYIRPPICTSSSPHILCPPTRCPPRLSSPLKLRPLLSSNL